MEKIKIKSIALKEWNGKKFWNIEDETGRTGSCNDEKIASVLAGAEIEMEVKPTGKEYNGKPTYYFNLPRAQGAGGKGGGAFAGKNWAKENRIAALNAAAQSGLSAEGIIENATKYETWLNR